MKKVLLTTCLALAICILVGCDSQPTNFDHQDKRWKLWKEGTIDKKHISLEVSGLEEKRIFVLRFMDGDEVKSTRFHKFEDIVEGSNGRLYCWDGRDFDNTYQWQPSGRVAPAIKPVEEEPKQVVVYPIKPNSVPTPVIDVVTGATTTDKYKWHSAANQPPTPGKTVVIEFKDGLLTMGYYTRTKEWKTDVGRKKLSGGIALKDVSRWKLVDLR